jgi:hypothetical protein
MKALQDKNRILWLVLLIGIVAALAIYRMGIPVPAYNDQAVTSPEQPPPQETQTKSNEAEPAVSAESPEPALQPSDTTDSRLERPTERRYCSERPLYFRVVFGQESNDSMLGVLDESGGSDSGYNVAYIDENMNGDLADEAAKEFPRRKLGSRTGELEPRFEFTGPFKGTERAKYTLYIYSLARKSRTPAPGNGYSFIWFVDINQWNYFFLNGKMSLFSNAADALKGNPVRLGSQCQWEISARTRDGKPMISAGLKDINGCTLRIVRRAGQTVSPKLTLIQDGQIKAEEKMKFG